MGKQVFEAVIERHPKFAGAAYVTIPFDVQEVYGTRGQIKVKVTIDGHPYRGSIANMGTGGHILGIKKEVRQAIGKTHGDTVRIEMERDTEPRVVSIPDDLKAALEANPDAGQFFQRLSYTHKKEYVNWIESAKKAETRQTRLEKTIARLLEKVKHP
ncbi:MAG: DUF1905 domain-containing protein [Calditrichaeota bacterium]|nr:MAG: DUF1905 domain-containing protein [Calditrichota bacterium]